MIATEHTIPEKVLLAASDLAPTFSAEVLVVGAWRQFPATFGLTGFADQFPNANTVLACLMGKKGLVARGWLDRKGAKLYALTPLGRARVNRILAGEPEQRKNGKPVASVVKPKAATKASRPATDLDAALQYLFDGKVAMSLYRAGKRQDLTFADAMRFWSIRDGDVVGERLTAVASAAAGLMAAGEMVLSNGRVVTADDGRLLSEVDAYLRGRFQRHLDMMARRAV